MAQPKAEPEGAHLFQGKGAQAELPWLLLFFLLFLQGNIAKAAQVEASVCLCFPLALGGSYFWAATVATWEAAFQNQKLSEWILQHLPAVQGRHWLGLSHCSLCASESVFFLAPSDQGPKRAAQHQWPEAAVLMLVGRRQPRDRQRGWHCRFRVPKLQMPEGATTFVNGAAAAGEMREGRAAAIFVSPHAVVCGGRRLGGLPDIFPLSLTRSGLRRALSLGEGLLCPLESVSGSPWELSNFVTSEDYCYFLIVAGFNRLLFSHLYLLLFLFPYW